MRVVKGKFNVVQGDTTVREYNVLFNTVVKGRVVRYHHTCETVDYESGTLLRVGGSIYRSIDMKNADEHARLIELHTLRTFLTAYTMLQTLKEKLPNVPATIKDRNMVFTEVDSQELLERASVVGATPW